MVKMRQKVWFIVALVLVMAILMSLIILNKDGSEKVYYRAQFVYYWHNKVIENEKPSILL